MRAAADVSSAYAIYTVEPLKLWNEHIDGHGNALDNVLVGNRGDNLLTGGAGNDTFEGGAGHDALHGGTGSDLYVFGRGDGVDTIVEDDASVGHTDTVLLDAGIAADQIWFSRSGDDLELSLIGTDDKMVVSNWYLGDRYRVERFQAGDGRVLLDAQVNRLVEAMAQFEPPAPGEITLAPHHRAGLDALIAAQWQ